MGHGGSSGLSARQSNTLIHWRHWRVVGILLFKGWYYVSRGQFWTIRVKNSGRESRCKPYQTHDRMETTPGWKGCLERCCAKGSGTPMFTNSLHQQDLMNGIPVSDTCTIVSNVIMQFHHHCSRTACQVIFLCNDVPIIVTTVGLPIRDSFSICDWYRYYHGGTTHPVIIFLSRMDHLWWLLKT